MSDDMKKVLLVAGAVVVAHVAVKAVVLGAVRSAARRSLAAQNITFPLT